MSSKDREKNGKITLPKLNQKILKTSIIAAET
jgi:hypothetical protein